MLQNDVADCPRILSRPSGGVAYKETCFLGLDTGFIGHLPLKSYSLALSLIRNYAL
jgi:hypothetical protein